MRVPSDFQIPVTAPRSGVLEALGLKIGETVTAQVVGQNANGSTLVQIGNQQVSLNLPQQFPPGTNLQFEVKGGGGGAKVELALLTSRTNTGTPAATAQQPAQPQVIVSQSILNQNAQSPAHQNGAQPSAQGQPAAQASSPQSSAYPRPPLVQPQTSPNQPNTASTPAGSQSPTASSSLPTGTPTTAAPTGTTPQVSTAALPAGASPQPPSPSASTTAPAPGAAAPVTPTQTLSIPLPAQAATTLGLTPGQPVTVHVAPPNAQGQSQITIGSQTVSVSAANLPAPGTQIQAQVVSQGGQLTLVAQAQRPTPSPYPAASQSNGSTNPSTAAQASTVASSPSGQVAQAATQANLSVPLPPPNLTQVAGAALARQDSVGKLITTITGLSTATTQALPSNVSQLAQQIAQAPIRLDARAPTADTLKDLVARSGVFLEAALARGVLPQTGAQGDLKHMLMLLRNALGNWLDGEPLPQPRGSKPAPPLRGAPPRPDGQQPQTPLPENISAREAGRHLLAQTEAALSRIRLFQLSSLPEAAQRGNPAAAQELHFELPLMLGDQTALAQFQVNRDGGDQTDPSQRGWHMSFAVHFNVIGAVGAKISFRARKTGVFVWAENEQTAETLDEMLPELVDRLEAQGLDLSSVMVRHHTPTAQKTEPSRSGGYVNAVS